MGQFLQWDPSQTNMETDQQYSADPTRAGGAVDGSPFPAILANKLFYQCTTFIASFALMLTNAGYSIEDSASAALVAQLSAAVALLKSPQFTGTPLAPTPASSDNSTRLATTAWVWNWLTNLISLTSPGGIKLGPLIIQWGGFTTSTGNNETVTLWQPFPNNCWAITVSEGAAHGGWNTTAGPTIYGASGVGLGPISSFGISCMRLVPGGASWSFSAGDFCTWIAIGY